MKKDPYAFMLKRKFYKFFDENRTVKGIEVDIQQRKLIQQSV